MRTADVPVFTVRGGDRWTPHGGFGRFSSIAIRPVSFDDVQSLADHTTTVVSHSRPFVSLLFL